jgi:excisionase family DNA binding protein
MTTQVLQYVELSGKDRKTAKPLGEALGKLGRGDRVEVRVRRKSGKEEVLSLPPKAAALLETALEHLVQGERVAVLAEDVEVSPNEAAEILGMSRPLVVHRMDRGHLPFHYVGNHRRAKLKDVLAFKEKVDAQQAAMKKLTELGEELWEQYGI